MSTFRSDERGKRFSLVIPLLLALVVGVVVGRLWPFHFGGAPDKTAEPRQIDGRGDLFEDEKINIDVFDRCAPSTVNVRTYTNARGPRVPYGSGSGFVWDDKGRIVTNAHVIAGARTSTGIDRSLIEVTLANGKNYNVIDANAAVDADLAVLWIDAPKEALHFTKIGESKTLKVGQKVYAIGNPFGLTQSLTNGIISALGRELRPSDSGTTMHSLIQIDAAINPGNSGGPLFDSAGRLIGVNTAIVSPSGASAGVGFAIPIDEVNAEVTRLIRGEKKIRPALGVYVASEQPSGFEGVLVMGVIPDGPADKAGIVATTREGGKIRLGDIIVAIDGKKIRNREELFRVLGANFTVGQEVAVTVLRDVAGERKNVDLKLTLTGSTG